MVTGKIKIDAVTEHGPPDPDVRPHFDRLLDRILDGLVGVRAAEGEI